MRGVKEREMTGFYSEVNEICLCKKLMQLPEDIHNEGRELGRIWKDMEGRGGFLNNIEI